jgi:hypothetical protein
MMPFFTGRTDLHIKNHYRLLQRGTKVIAPELETDSYSTRISLIPAAPLARAPALVDATPQVPANAAAPLGEEEPTQLDTVNAFDGTDNDESLDGYDQCDILTWI